MSDIAKGTTTSPNSIFTTSGLAEISEIDARKLALLERETSIKEEELRLKRIEAGKSAWKSPLVVAILATGIGAFANAGVAFFNAREARSNLRLSAENQRIQESIKLTDPERVRTNLQFMIDVGLITDPALIARLVEYYSRNTVTEGPASEPPSSDIRTYRDRFSSFIQQQQLKFITPEELLFLGAGSSTRNGTTLPENSLPTEDLWPNIAKVAKVVDEFRSRHGHPVRLTSIYRTPAYSASIGGGEESLHTKGLAIDFRSEVGTPEEWAKILIGMRDEGLFSGGIGTHNAFVHVDVRGTDATW